MPTLKEWSRADPNVSMLIAAYSGTATHAEGPPGVAKSSVIHQWAHAAGREMILLIGSTHAPEDFSGIPFVSECKKFFRQTPPEWAERLSRPGALLFLDELTTVPPSVRAAMLSMLTERRLGSLMIHPDTLIFAASNPSNLAPNASPLEKSMANRFYHCQWKHDYSAWQSGMMSEDDDFKPSWSPVVASPKDWKRFRPQMGSLIVSYTNKNSNDRIAIPTNDDEKAFATPRTWKYLRDALCVAESLDAPSDIKKELSVGLVGKQTGKNFMQYYDQRDLIDVEAALSNPSSFKHDKRRADLTVTLLTTVVTEIKRQYSDSRMDAAVELFCSNVGKDTADLVLTQLRHLVEARPDNMPLSKKSLASISEFGKRIPDHLKRKKAG
jgi:hypothetical protein